MSSESPQVRIGDAEREATVTALGEHFAAGRLDRDEFDERTARAYAARTAGELRPLFADLPMPHPFAPRRPPRADSGTASARKSSAGGSRRRPRLPLVPLLVVALVVMIVSGIGWPLFLLAFGLWWMSRSFARQGGGWGCAGHSRGSERASRGSWA